jgi:tetratricopeptide (TPR) repeat protein
MQNSDSMQLPAKLLWIPLVIMVLAAGVFSNTLENDFVMGWDDELQVVNNTDIKDITFNNLKNIFQSYYVGMYQPLSTLTYALYYQIWERNPRGYHLTNLFLHLINILLVFIFFYYLSGNVAIPSVVALLFAVHPMNVESVAWVSTRSNLLYAAFYLSALIAYLWYLRKQSYGRLSIVFILFLLSLFSKAMAITLPFVLILLDLYTGRKIDRKAFQDKIPFVALSVLFAFIAFDARTEVSHLGSFEQLFSPFEQLILITSSLMYYLWALVYFNDLSPLHYYPRINNPAANLDWYYYAGAVLFVIFAVYVIILIYQAIRKKSGKNPVLFGLLFFALSISVVIHFVPIGMQIVAERYAYIPYLGLFYIFAFYVARMQNKKIQKAVFAGIGLMAIIMSLTSYRQNRIWKNTDSLMHSVIIENPKAWHAYLVRADGFYLQGKYHEALQDYEKSLELKPDFDRTYVNIANVYAAQNQYDKTIQYLNQAIALNPKTAQSWFNRGQAKFNLKDYQGAVQDFDKTLALKPDQALALMYRGIAEATLGNLRDGLQDLKAAVRIAPGTAKAQYALGVALLMNKEYAQAVNSFSRALQLKADYPEALLQRGIAYIYSGNTKAACIDFRKASQYPQTQKQAMSLLAKYCN